MEEDKIKEIEEKRIKGIRKEIVGDEFDGVSNANIEYAMEVYASYIREKTLNEMVEVVGEKIMQPQNTLKMDMVEEYIWHENNGRNAEKRRILKELTNLKK